MTGILITISTWSFTVSIIRNSNCWDELNRTCLVFSRLFTLNAPRYMHFLNFSYSLSLQRNYFFVKETLFNKQAHWEYTISMLGLLVKISSLERFFKQIYLLAHIFRAHLRDLYSLFSRQESKPNSFQPHDIEASMTFSDFKLSWKVAYL